MQSQHLLGFAAALLVFAGVQACVKDAPADSSPSESASIGAAPSRTDPSVDAGVSTPNVRVEVSFDLERSCREICDRSRVLQCSNLSKCMPNCLGMGSLTPCSEPMQAFFQCLRKQPVANWQCAPEGVAAIRDGFCDKEQAETVQCMQAKMRR
jgi:hypothetical protein